MKDEQIIDLYFERKESAIAETEKKYGIPLERLAGQIVLPEDAKECVNDTYMNAWTHIPPTRPTYFFAWLAKVCRNLALKKVEWSQAKKRNAQIVVLTRELEECVPDQAVEAESDAKELGKLLSVFLNELPEKKRFVFLRRYWYGDTVGEIAKENGMKEGNVKITLFRLRGELKKYLEKEGVWVER